MQWVDTKAFGGLGQRIGFERFALGFLFLAIGGLVGSVVLGRTSLPVTPLLEHAPLERPVAALRLTDAETVAAAFGSQGYRLDRVREEGVVPRVFLAVLPSDLEAIQGVRERKRLFLQTVLPLILHVNETIAEQRKRALALTEAKQRGVRLATKDSDWLRDLYAYYRVPEGDLSELLRRVDVIPPSLALAQAAEESGWGTSRFAQEGNAIFGQWTLSLHRGLVPLERGGESRVAVRSFRDLAGSVRAYTRNLNTHLAYRELRAKREALRRRDIPLNGYTLAGTLRFYSERGEAYIQTLRSLIRSNKLRHFDRARLTGDVYASLPESGA
ncbi:MAG: glucosaminidase domain-containing protein [Alphaproteobacteria bacterium]|nr:glucosaminidase domain-containing protein [Alphaproteobacteria bacterium]